MVTPQVLPPSKDGQIQGPFYSLSLYYRARKDDPNTSEADGSDRMFMVVADPVPNLATACRMAWFVLGKYRADYGLLYFEQSEDLLLDDGPWMFKPRYRLVPPNEDYGSILDIKDA